MSLLVFIVLCLGIYHWTHSSSSVASKTQRGTVFVNGTAPIGRIDDDFVCATIDWWPPDKCDFGTCSWGTASLLNLDLNDPILVNAIRAFSSLKIRLGGTLQDKVIYETQDNKQPCTPFVKKDSDLLGFSQGCLPMSRWDELNTFFNRTGAVVVFGLNALRGRTIDSQGSATGAWNSSNAESLMRYTVNKGYKIHGWELGNELSGRGIGAGVAPDQYASDINHLQNIVQKIYEGFEVKPLVLAPGGFFDPTWFTEFLDKTPKSLQVVTHHVYNLGPGSDEHLIDKILNPSVLSSESGTFGSLQSILKHSGTSAVAWVGEAGGAYNSGRNLVTNAFVFSFWYLDQLGMAASYDTKTYCRQTLIGGNYGLLNTNTFVPNPDYYSALLWHRLMGNNVISTNFSGTTKMRAYAHCSKKTRGITLLLINLEKDTTVNVRVSTETDASSKTLNTEHRRTTPSTMSQGSISSENITREEYHLTAKNGNLESQNVHLNGKILNVDSSGVIPPLDPINKSVSEPITVAPFSIVFALILNIDVPACL
ncbi:Heparanase-like protein 3 [Morus notabilis]|uniref:Heparanase-like protein 3 n=1 Tax=Morus notabilis TaxID=981085 RepID=W9RLK4_9ROSA|nr:heparanase-like protein 3 [Morus notabilis]EXB80736.1 Heparanase-like protein 3 [Morus notabilis]